MEARETTLMGPAPVVLLGSTGSIGTQAREVIEAHRGRFDVLGLSTGGSSITELAAQIVALEPAYVGVARDVREELAAAVESMGGTCPEVFVGENASVEVVCASVELAAQLYPCETPVVLNGITGGVGLSSTLAPSTVGHAWRWRIRNPWSWAERWSRTRCFSRADRAG